MTGVQTCALPIYVKKDLQERLKPIALGWHNVRCPNYLTQAEIALRPDARRYEAGSHGFVGLHALRAALDQERAQAKQDAAREREALGSDRQETRREREELKREIERLNRRAEQLDARGEKLDSLEERLEDRARHLTEQEQEIGARLHQADLKLFEIAGLSPEAARADILTRLDAELEEEKAIRVKAMQERASADAKRSARHVIAQAIQRSASETSAALSVSVVPIPNEIGRAHV